MSYRTALITGASSGLGAGLARRLASSGTEVVLVARRQELLETLAAEIRGAGGKALVKAVDVADPGAITAAVQQADDELGGLDLVVANAGVGKERFSGKLTFEDCAAILSVNVVGATATLTAVVSRMAERKRGHLVGVSSLAGFRGIARSAAYSASKAYLSTFLEALRVDLSPLGVAVTDVRPGFVKTPLTAQNKHPMPMLMELDDAVTIMLRGIERRERVVAFPATMAAAAGVLRFMPDALWDRASRRKRR